MAETEFPSTLVKDPPTNKLFVGGQFTSVDGGSIPANSIASWDGNSWNILGINSTNNGVNGIAYVYTLAMNGTNNLFVGGQFPSVDGFFENSVNNIASWNGNSWNILGTNSTYNGVGIGGIDFVYALVMNGTNNLFVGGQFTSVDGGSILANNIASWDGNSWNILGINSTNNGVGGTVNALAMNGTNQLFVGGQFTSVDGNSILANNIASWNGNSWNILGINSTNNGVGIGGTSFVKVLAMNGTNQLFVGGSFTNVDGGSTPANYIASWDGNSYSSILGNGMDNEVQALSFFQTSLVIGGLFTISPDGFCEPYLIQSNFLLFFSHYFFNLCRSKNIRLSHVIPTNTMCFRDLSKWNLCRSFD